MSQENIIYQSVYEEALRINRKCIDDWTEYKKKLTELSSNLEFYPKELSHQVLIPLGKKALIRGNLIHTNEVLINLGANTFIKRSTHGAKEVCNRSIKRCDEKINDLKREQTLLSSNISAVFNEETFGNNSSQIDLVEPYNEDQEKQWRQKHREEVKRYKLQEKLEKSDSITYEDAMKRLDDLELEEELGNNEGFENGILLEGSSDSDYSNDTLTDYSEYEMENGNEGNGTNENSVDIATKSKNKVTYKTDIKRVSFSNEVVSTSSDLVNNEEDQVPTIYFEHTADSQNEENSSDNNENVPNFPKSPSDIFKMYSSTQKSKTLKSILKVSEPSPNIQLQINKPDNINTQSVVSAYNFSSLEEHVPRVPLLGDIVEKYEQPSIIQTVSMRPISKFKASRNFNK